MIISPSLIPELDDIISRGDPRRRADAARRISELFLQGAASFRADHVDLFDGVLSSLVPHAELRSEEHTSELQSQSNLVCRLLLEKKNKLISCLSMTRLLQ